MRHVAAGDAVEFGIDRGREALESVLIPAAPGPQEARDFNRWRRRKPRPAAGIIQPCSKNFYGPVVVGASESRLRAEGDFKMAYTIRGFLSRPLCGALTMSLLFAAGLAADSDDNDNQHWVGTWSTALHEPDLGVPGLSNAGFNNQTLRQMVH